LSSDKFAEDINENLGAVLYIMLGRIYDMLILLADASGKGEDALQLINLHSQGQLMSPPPSLMLEDYPSEDDDDKK